MAVSGKTGSVQRPANRLHLTIHCRGGRDKIGMPAAAATTACWLKVCRG